MSFLLGDPFTAPSQLINAVITRPQAASPPSDSTLNSLRMSCHYAALLFLMKMNIQGSSLLTFSCMSSSLWKIWSPLRARYRPMRNANALDAIHAVKCKEITLNLCYFGQNVEQGSFYMVEMLPYQVILPLRREREEGG